MKTNRRSLVALSLSLAALGLTPACVAPQARQAYSHPVGLVERRGDTVVARGDTMSAVRTTLGIPDLLSDDVWTYHNFDGGSAQSRHDDCSILLLTFTQGRVSNIELVNERAKANVVARLRVRPSDNAQFAATLPSEGTPASLNR
jgi:hypothetical protein